MNCWMTPELEPVFLQDHAMFITTPDTYSTSRERNADYKEFMDNLAKCESRQAISFLKMGCSEMFTKLRNEKAEGYTYHGFDYLDELANAIEKQRELIGDYNGIHN